jgi:hypothetical protein
MGRKYQKALELAVEQGRNFGWNVVAFPHREKTMGSVPSVPAFENHDNASEARHGKKVSEST